ncbi:MAG TPA: hypothetical protein VHQ65_04585 [Thermoanaerobaculia bacterium]|nr:hypothetical protein [Thermoanaerobaculia bacterium]
MKPRNMITLLLSGLALGALSLPAAAQPGVAVHLAAGQRANYTYTVPAHQITVITLKHVRGDTDFDYLARSAGGDRRLASGANYGRTTELDFVVPAEYPQEIEIWVQNNGRRSGTYRLITHDVDPAELLGQALAEAMIEELLRGLLGLDDSAASQQIDRAITGGLSMLQGRNLAQTSETLVLAEIESFVANEMGTGVVGRVTFKFLAGFAGELYRYY